MFRKFGSVRVDRRKVLFRRISRRLFREFADCDACIWSLTVDKETGIKDETILQELEENSKRRRVTVT
jgi:GTPase Era involved in 16S rRNA processing